MAKAPSEIPATKTAGMSWDDIRNFVRHEITLKNNYIIDVLKNYYMYTNDRRMELLKDDEERRSNLKSPMTNMFVSKVTNMVLGMDMRFVATNIFPSRAAEAFAEDGVETPGVEEETHPGNQLASEMLAIMNSVWQGKTSHTAFKDGLADAVLLGWGIYKIAYNYSSKKEEVAVKGGGKSEKVLITRDTPEIRYVSPLNFFIDPGATTIDNARFIIERKLLNDVEIQKEYGFYGITIDSKKLDASENNVISFTDYESVKRNMPYYNSSIKRDITSDKTYNIKKATREVLEVHTQDGLVLYINGIKFGPYGQVGPNKGYRYKVFQYKKNPGTMFALGLGHLMAPIQLAYDKILNTRQDNITLVGNKMFLYNDAFNISGNSRRLKLKPGMLHKVTDLDAIRELNTGDIKESQYAETNALFSMLQAFTGVSSNGLGLQDKVERTAGGAETLQGAMDDGLRPLMDSVIENMADTMKEVLIMAKYYMEESTIAEILGADNLFSKMDIKDIIGDYEYDFNMESQNHKKSAVERQQLLTLLQTLNGMVDAAGRPIMDTREVAQKIWDGYDMEGDPILDKKSFQADIKESEDFKASLQQPAQPPAPGGMPAEEGASNLKSLQSMGGANLPPEMSTNPQGKN